MPIRRRPTTDQLYWRFQYKGRIHEKSMETSSLREARDRGTRWEAEVKNQQDQAATPELYPTLAKLRDLDVARMRDAGRSEVYIKQGILQQYKWLMAFFPDVRAVTTESLKEYVKHRLAMKVRRQTITRELATLKRGLYLAEIPGPPYWPRLARDKADPKLVSKRHSLQRWTAFLSALEGEAYDVALFALLTGLRHYELYRVQPDLHVEEIEGFVVLTVQEKVKRVQQRQVVLGPLARSILPRMPFKANHKKAYLRATREAAGATGNITLRDCRAAFATAGDKAGDSRATDMAMGHSGVPARYQKSDYERLAKVAEAVERWLTTGTAASTVVTPDK